MQVIAARQSFASEQGAEWWIEPSITELLLLACIGCLLFLATITSIVNYTSLVDNFGDTSAYMSIASAIRHWNFQGVVVKQFWGLPYLMAAVSTLTRMSDRSAVLLVSFVSSFIVVTFAYRLWGGWVAGFFAVLNFDWWQRSFLGGSEPLFLALLFGAFVSVRRERWTLAALLASLSTIVRPLGIFALVGIGLTLLWRRDFRRFALATAIGLLIGILYVLPLAHNFGDPLANVTMYHKADWDNAIPFSWPFYAFARDAGLQRAPWTNLVLTFGWISFVLLGGTVMAGSVEFRQYARSHPVETVFAASYLIFLYTYNSAYWARSNFPRFAIPVLPFVLLALGRWIPKDRRLLFGLGLISPVLAAASAIGVKNVVHTLHMIVM